MVEECMCGHMADEHVDETDDCTVTGCGCNGYEEVLEEDEP
jgi:hypothetical protein